MQLDLCVTLRVTTKGNLGKIFFDFQLFLLEFFRLYFPYRFWKLQTTIFFGRKFFKALNLKCADNFYNAPEEFLPIQRGRAHRNRVH